MIFAITWKLYQLIKSIAYYSVTHLFFSVSVFFILLFNPSARISGATETSLMLYDNTSMMYMMIQVWKSIWKTFNIGYVGRREISIKKTIKKLKVATSMIEGVYIWFLSYKLLGVSIKNSKERTASRILMMPMSGWWNFNSYYFYFLMSDSFQKYKHCLHNSHYYSDKQFMECLLRSKNKSVDISIVNIHVSSSFSFEVTLIILQMKIGENPGRVVIHKDS